MKLLFAIIIAALMSACTDADVASSNISKAADQFEVNRRIVFYNGITGEYLLVIEGRCSLGNDDKPSQRTVVCKLPDNTYRKHFLGLSDNVTYMAEQIGGINVSVAQYRVIFKPSVLIPTL